MSTLKNRHEILFVYDVSWANPNGDPMDENKPRIDEETGINIVTDVRLKRTIRDALMELYPDYKVFIREERKKNGNLKTKEEIFTTYKNDPKTVLEKCIDIRLFGGTFALKNNQAFSLTGPVQFKFGHSLHRVKVELIKGTTVIPSSQKGEKGTYKGKSQGTFTEVYVVPYSLIVFYGIANEKAAETTLLTEEDLDAMFKAMWVGHKASTDVITRSKFGHEPRLLLDIVYKEGTLTHMGELDKLISFKSDKEDEAIRDIEDGVLNLEALKEKVEKYKDKIQKVRYKIGDRVKLDPPLEDVFAGVKDVELEEFLFDSEA